MFNVYVQPRSSRSRLEGVREGSLKIALTAPPVRGRANQQLVSLLADLLGLKKLVIEILSGEKSRLKRIKISQITCQELLDKLNSHL